MAGEFERVKELLRSGRSGCSAGWEDIRVNTGNKSKDFSTDLHFQKDPLFVA